MLWVRSSLPGFPVALSALLLAGCARHAETPPDRNGLTAGLWSAIQSRRLVEVRNLVEQGADIESTTPMKARTRGELPGVQVLPLQYAVLSLDLEMAALLLDLGAEVNALDAYGCTPVTAAREVFRGQKRHIPDEEKGRRDRIIGLLEARGGRPSFAHERQVKWFDVGLVRKLGPLEIAFEIQVRVRGVEYISAIGDRQKAPSSRERVQELAESLLRAVGQLEGPDPDPPYYKVFAKFPPHGYLEIHLPERAVRDGAHPGFAEWLRAMLSRFPDPQRQVEAGSG